MKEKILTKGRLQILFSLGFAMFLILGSLVYQTSVLADVTNRMRLVCNQTVDSEGENNKTTNLNDLCHNAIATLTKNDLSFTELGPLGASPLPTASASPASTTKIVFASDWNRPGNFGGIAVADNVCQSEAAAVPSLAGRTFKAWISTANATYDLHRETAVDPQNAVNAKDRFTDKTTIYTLNDASKTPIGSINSITGAGSILAPINKNASGGTPNNAAGVPQVNTGTASDGNFSRYSNHVGFTECDDDPNAACEYTPYNSVNTCLNWSSSQDKDYIKSTRGDINATNGNWTGITNRSCVNFARLYCFQSN